MFITPLAAMIFTVILLIVACLTIYIVTKISDSKHITYDKNRLSFFRMVVAVIYFTIMIMLILNLGFNPEIKFGWFEMFGILIITQVVILPLNAGFWDSSRPVYNMMLLMVTDTVPFIILQYIALLCS